MKSLINNVIPLVVATVLVSSSAFAKDGLLVVGTSKLSELLISAKNSAPANIISLNHTTVSAEITGRTLTIQVKTGDYVREGDKLTSIDCRSYSLSKKQAEASLKVAKTQLNYSEKQFKRNQRLVKTGIIPRETFEKAEASKLTALADIQLKKASIETTKLAMSRCQIYAPFSGQVTKRFVQKGQLMSPGTPLFMIMQSDEQEIKANLSPADIAKLDDTTLIDFVVAKKHFEVNLRSVIQNVDETTRTQEVRLELPQNAKVSAGLSGRIEWSGKARLLPAEYLIRRNSILGIMIAEDIVEGIGHARFHQIVGAREGQAVEIELPENTVVITKNRYRVKSGQDIKVKKVSGSNNL